MLWIEGKREEGKWRILSFPNFLQPQNVVKNKGHDMLENDIDINVNILTNILNMKTTGGPGCAPVDGAHAGVQFILGKC